ncbi:MAG: HD domain-containing protein [Flavobacteriaceae bacterium]
MELHNKESYPKLCLDLLEEMSEKFPSHLTYHTIEHIIDVANVCDHYIKEYKIQDDIARLIRIAAISHDYGYIFSPEEHEERSIKELRPKLNGSFSDEDIELINGMIRATKVPQKPKNFYEEIVADADLDYLGRDDYNELSENLYQEFLHYGVVSNDEQWLELQINFLESHQYHVSLALENRTTKKQKKLSELKNNRSGASSDLAVG